MNQMFNNYVNVLDEKCFTSNVYDEKFSKEEKYAYANHAKHATIF